MNITATPSAVMEREKSSRKAPVEQPAREQNIQAIIAYYESGVKSATGEVGIELEHTIVKQDGLQPVSYSEEHGVHWLLEELNSAYPEATYAEDGDLLGVSRTCEAVTLEPAAQLELSAGPFKSLASAEACFNAFENTLAQTLSPVGLEALTIGYHPTARAQDLELIPKRRYKFMNLYLGEISPWGPRMMRGSASTQVSIDFSSVNDCLRKLRLAYALVPVFSLICDNSPVFEGKKRPHELMRTEIWKYCDPDRCGLVPGVMDESFTMRAYAEYVLDTPAILVSCAKHGWCYSEQTFGELYADTVMTRAEVEHALSMFFNDVRLKTYIEIRPADAMPIPYVIAYAGLVKGLFATPETLDALDALLAGVSGPDIETAKEALMARGYEADVYGRPVAALCDEVVSIARMGLSDDEAHFLEPLARLVADRVTLADLAEAE
ncbi:glutamate-cysteine ligase family protein [Raoultibacter phocaeensis]|uniref:glutamate-cysteine ligase family protein n=1 Tax=Raoultibacter phocaeensis TaxID=2479841 RepID=UPI0021062788|nr:glutamate-cysteine ligase family protein [Raoultibacter phocaeensis]